jgi:hypothetical protein
MTTQTQTAPAPAKPAEAPKSGNGNGSGKAPKAVQVRCLPFDGKVYVLATTQRSDAERAFRYAGIDAHYDYIARNADENYTGKGAAEARANVGVVLELDEDHVVPVPPLAKQAELTEAALNRVLDIAAQALAAARAEDAAQTMDRLLAIEKLGKEPAIKRVRVQVKPVVEQPPAHEQAEPGAVQVADPDSEVAEQAGPVQAEGEGEQGDQPADESEATVTPMPPTTRDRVFDALTGEAATVDSIVEHTATGDLKALSESTVRKTLEVLKQEGLAMNGDPLPSGKKTWLLFADDEPVGTEQAEGEQGDEGEQPADVEPTADETPAEVETETEVPAEGDEPADETEVDGGEDQPEGGEQDATTEQDEPTEQDSSDADTDPVDDELNNIA